MHRDCGIQKPDQELGTTLMSFFKCAKSQYKAERIAGSCLGSCGREKRERGNE